MYASGELSRFIDFFWETDFDQLWQQYPQGFSDVLFPNLGYTFLINLGTPLVMQVNEINTPIRNDGFLPRLNHIECFHQAGNLLFGIKFKVSPVLFEKRINFSEYKGQVFSLSYLMDAQLLQQVRSAVDFEQRVQLLQEHYLRQLNTHKTSLHKTHVVTSVLEQVDTNNDFLTLAQERAAAYGVSAKTLQRYFKECTGVSYKNALQVMRIRSAISKILQNPRDFHAAAWGYYDHSHFYKHLRRFLSRQNLIDLQPHLHLLKNLHKKEDR